LNEVLRVNNLGFGYSMKEIFSDISFSISPGEILCLMGPNGCGKTTLLDNIMAIHKPKGGDITLMGQPIGNYKRIQIAQNIAYVPQIHNITFPYTVREIVMMGRTAHTGPFSEPNKVDEKICIEALEKVGILNLAQKPYSNLSGGEVKLVLLARALSQKTSIIIMDEPTAYLDFKNELLFLETIVELCQYEKIAILMATHSPEHAFYFASKNLPVKAALMSEGQFAAYGKPDTVVTEQNIERVFGVKAKLHCQLDDRGCEIKTINLLRTIKEVV
jgi:iron complex transport system ATP-binding protein